VIAFVESRGYDTGVSLPALAAAEDHMRTQIGRKP
jgi:hypothetical protein